MSQARIPAVFMRGGTSRAIFFRNSDLPTDPAARDRLFLAALGGPDPYGRQLDGLGGGSSSTSKIAIIGPGTEPGVDVNFTFAQVDVGSPRVDYKGNCGNISSAVGPYAIEEGLARGPSVTIFNTNTKKRILALVPMDGDQPATRGNFELPGVPGHGARIALDFQDPGGAVTGRLLPTGTPRDRLDVPGLGPIDASLIDATNPMVFVRAADLGLTGVESPEALDRDRELAGRIEAIRAAGAVAMGIAPSIVAATERSPAVPKVAMVAPPRDYRDIAGSPIRADEVDLTVLVVSMGKIHRAVALTAAMCLAVAARVPGSIPAEAAAGLAPGADVRIGHPSGVLPLAATVVDGRAENVRVYRTARRLMEGFVRVPAEVLTDPNALADRVGGVARTVAE
ncbi:MAG: hypothetical protein EPO26_07000 [Chloroflexota bacterium]|nr:MAG: hypothetical protein EPO26_07000 [Chloroflexota bacterium]